MAALGFDDDEHVVAYDDAGGTIAARLWWMLDDLGHPDVRLLDGGIAAWVAAGGPLTADVPAPPAGRLTPARPLDADDRPRRARGAAGHRRPHRRAGAGALSRRGRAGRCASPATSPPRSTGRRRQPGTRRAVPGRPDALRARFAAPGRRGRDLLRQRGQRLPQRAGDAGRRAAGSAPLPRVVQRLDAGRGCRSRRATSPGSLPGAGAVQPRAAGAPADDERLEGDASAAANPIARSPEQRDLEAEQRDLRAHREPEPVADQVERAERGR